MKIVSLLPSATEIVFALGLGDSLEGVSYDCDYPPEAGAKPVVSGTALPAGVRGNPREVDAAVAETIAGGEPIYTLDAERIGAIRPDLILAQDLCRVCAVPSGAVDDALAVLGCRADVLSLDPNSLDDVIDCIGQVGEASGAKAEAVRLMGDLRTRVDRIGRLVAGRRRPRTFALEWSDPPFTGGHWVPDMIAAAGGEAVLAPAGAPSRRVTWSGIEASGPGVVVFMPCGYSFDEAVTEGRRLLDIPELDTVAEIYAVDASAHFSRPGPRVVEGVETLGWILHPDVVPAPPDGFVTRLR